MTKVKICGLRRQEDIDAVNRLKPEYVGFVFYEKSKRNVTEETAMALRKALDPNIISVGVFVDAEPELILRLMRKGIISIAQLHGHETAEYIENLKSAIAGSCSIMKAFLVKTKADVAAALETGADYILFDNGLGSGESFDWEILKDFPKPFFLAGGLSAANVTEAIERLSPYAVDISSGVETDGCKDPEKMRLFIDAVRRKNYV